MLSLSTFLGSPLKAGPARRTILVGRGGLNAVKLKQTKRRMTVKIRKLLSEFKRLSFSTRLFMVLFAFFCLMLAVDGWYTSTKIKEYLYSEIGKRALVQAKQIAVIPSLSNAIEHRDTAAIATLVKSLKKRTDADYIVIGDIEGNRLFHTESAVLLGSAMVGGDNSAVLLGESIISIRQGSLGYSLRGKAPVFNDKGKVVGIVSVGYLQDELQNIYIKQFMPVVMLLTGIFALLVCFAWFFTRNIGRQTLGLEPETIQWMVRQQEAVLESIFEGVIAVDTEYRLTAINRAAREMLEIKSPAATLIGKPFASVVEQQAFFREGVEAQYDRYDEFCLFNELQVIASKVRIMLDNKLQGWVITFRDRNDINTLSLQLSQNRRYAENLRVLRHEHLNWISTLSGLLHMKHYDEAIRLIETHSDRNQQILDYVSDTFKNHAIAGLLLGKFYRARELGLELVFDPGCQLASLPERLGEIEMMSVLGNLLDNAFDAARKVSEAGTKKITLFLSDAADDLVIEVADEGCGITEDVRERMFDRGISSSGAADRGIGLYLVHAYVIEAGGVITVEDNEPRGTIFSVFIPKGPSAYSLDDTRIGDQTLAND